MTWPDRVKQLKEQRDRAECQRDDLLTALEELEKWTEAYSISSGVTIEEEAKHFNPEFYAAMLQARAAIAKAKGGRLMWDRFEDWWLDSRERIFRCLFSTILTLALLIIILANFRKLVCIFEWSDAMFWGCL